MAIIMVLIIVGVRVVHQWEQDDACSILTRPEPVKCCNRNAMGNMLCNSGIITVIKMMIRLIYDLVVLVLLYEMRIVMGILSGMRMIILF